VNQTSLSLTSQRMMYDTVYYFGGPEKVPITKKTIFRFRSARTNYHNYLEEEKRKKCYANEQQNAAKARMQIIKDLERKKRKVLDAASNEVDAIDIELKKQKMN
jgi:hypothetical protein